MKKFFIKADVYNELIEKGYGKRDLSKLTRKVITDKNGHRRTVFVRNDVQTVKRNPSVSNNEDPRTGKKSYWIQDNRGNRLTNSDAKERVINNNKKIAELDKQISGMSKADAIRLNTQKHDLEYQNSYLMDRLNSEDRKEIGKKTSDNSSKEHDKDYYNFIEYLNGYDRTDSDEKEKYDMENERLKNKFPKEQMAKYFENAKERLSGSKEDIKKYLDVINIKNASNANFFIAEQAYKNLTGKEYSKTFADYVDKLNTEDMAEEIYNNIHFKGKEREEKRQSKTSSVGDAALNTILSNDFLMKNKVFREDEYTKRGVTKDDTGANGLRYFSPIQWNDDISKMSADEKIKLANEMRKTSEQLRKHTDKMADSKLKNLLESWETSLYKDAWALSH